jgi:hypothetical protein
MDYYESIVVSYLRADRALFVNTEYCIQLNPGDNPDSSGPHWYCDAVACDFRQHRIFLCEISYGVRLVNLIKRLMAWHENWDLVRNALVRDSCVLADWPVRPWLFVPEDRLQTLERWWATIDGNGQLPKYGPPLVTTLEMVQPWRYCSWNRIGEAEKPQGVPKVMRK